MTKQMTEDKKEYDLKMQEYAQLLDIRADRIRVSWPHASHVSYIRLLKLSVSSFM